MQRPADTLAAYQKILKIRDRILAGDDFESVAVATSDDDSARDNPQRNFKGNKGNLGYFSAFRMVYPFEEAAYTTPKLERFRCLLKHDLVIILFRVDSKLRPSKGEVEVAHILVTDLRPSVGKTKIDSKYIAKLIKRRGKSFDSLAKDIFQRHFFKEREGGKLNQIWSRKNGASF